MPASNTAAAGADAAPAAEDRFAALTPACLSGSEKSSIISLALKVLTDRYRPGRTFRAPRDIEKFLRLKLSGRRNEVFGVVYLDTRHRLIRMAELFHGSVDGATVYPRVVVQSTLENNAAAGAGRGEPESARSRRPATHFSSFRAPRRGRFRRSPCPIPTAPSGASLSIR